MWFWNHDHFFMHFKKLLTLTFWMTSKQKNASRKKNNNDKKFINEKTTNDNILNVKFINMTNRKSLKYVHLFINKTFNNFLWRSVI
jgi:hypothetical protein